MWYVSPPHKVLRSEIVRESKIVGWTCDEAVRGEVFTWLSFQCGHRILDLLVKRCSRSQTHLHYAVKTGQIGRNFGGSRDFCDHEYQIGMTFKCAREDHVADRTHDVELCLEHSNESRSITPFLDRL